MQPRLITGQPEFNNKANFSVKAIAIKTSLSVNNDEIIIMLVRVDR